MKWEGLCLMLITNQRMCQQPYKNECTSDTQMFSHPTYLNRRLNILCFCSTPLEGYQVPINCPSYQQQELPACDTAVSLIPTYMHHRCHSTQSRRREQVLQHDCLLTGPCKEAGWERTEINTGWEWPLLQVLWHLRIHTTAIYVCASPPNMQPNRECLFHFHNHLATCDIRQVYTMT